MISIALRLKIFLMLAEIKDISNKMDLHRLVLYNFSIKIPLVYNFSPIREEDIDSAYVMGIADDVVWQRTYPIGYDDKVLDGIADTVEEVMKFTLSCDRRDEGNRLSVHNFVLGIENVVAQDEAQALQMVESDVHRVCRTLSFQSSVHNCNKHSYQPRVQPDYHNVTWKESVYEWDERESVSDDAIDDYIDENGKRVIRVRIDENTVGIRNRISVFMTLSVWLSPEEFLQYYAIEMDADMDFIMEEFFVALGKEAMTSKFFHLFTIIEFVEKQYVDMAKAKPLLIESEISSMLKVLDELPDVESAVKNRVINSVKGNLIKMTDIGRAEKLVNILHGMGIDEIKAGAEAIHVDKKLVQSLIDLRNRSYHGGVSYEGKKYISVEWAVVQLMEICQNIIQYVGTPRI